MLLYKSGLNESLSAQRIKTAENFEFSKNTTYGLGGTATKAYYPKTVWQAKCVYNALREVGKDFKIIGNGSNLLVSDGGFDGSVISTKNLNGIIRLKDNRLLCLSGTKIPDLLSYCRREGLGGLEYLYGIPATVGGAAFMNAGVSGVAIGKNIESVRIYDGKSRILTNETCNFGYRRSTMRDINCIILSIILKVEQSDNDEIESRIAYYRQRRAHLPKGKSCGSVFKNPEGYSAGYLIEASGLKGFTLGGAKVSEQHANFVINCGGSAEDVRDVIRYVKMRVYEKFGVELEEEVVYIGEFYGFNS